MTDDKVLTALASLAVILLVGAVFGRLHGGDKNAANAALLKKVLLRTMTVLVRLNMAPPNAPPPPPL
jgi:hypothetical protein